MGPVGWRKLFSLLRLCLLHFGQSWVWQKENRTVNLMRIYVCCVSLSLYTVYHGIWVIKATWLIYLYRPRSDPEPLLSFENLRFIYLGFLSLSLKREWKKGVLHINLLFWMLIRLLHTLHFSNRFSIFHVKLMMCKLNIFWTWTLAVGDPSNRWGTVLMSCALPAPLLFFPMLRAWRR